MRDLFEVILGERRFERIDRQVTDWMQRYGMALLRYSLGVVFVWFGALKLVGMSPAEELVKRTVYFFPPDLFYPVLGWWEVAIGVGLMVRPLLRVAILLLLLQMPGTMLPMVVVPEAVWNSFPFALTLEGQYMIKNLVLISAALVVGGMVRKESGPERWL